jgi:acid phosphatase type 7
MRFKSACTRRFIGVAFFVSLCCGICGAGLKASAERANIVIYGDSRSNHDVHKKIISALMKVNPRIVFHTGDMVDDGGNVSQWKIFNKLTRRLRQETEFFPCIGNHEGNSPLYFRNFPALKGQKWYSLERFHLKFVVLDCSSPLGADSLQYQWLHEQLEDAARLTVPVVIIMHNPLFSVSKHRDMDIGLKTALAELFQRYRVMAVFAGHDHNYQRFYHQGTYYVVTGGGGAPLYWQSIQDPENQVFAQVYHFCVLSQSANGWQVTVYDSDLKVIDTFVLGDGMKEKAMFEADTVESSTPAVSGQEK